MTLRALYSFFGSAVFMLFFVALSASAAADHVLISEVQYDPSGAENEAEYVELYNPTPYDVDISGWTLKEAITPYYTFPASTTIGAGEYLLLVNDTTAFNVTFPAVTPDIDMDGGNCASATECIRLNNGGDSLTLTDGDPGVGTIVDFVAWEGAVSGWTVTANNGESICRSSSDDTDTNADWTSNCTPDPGTASYVPDVFVELTADSADLEATGGNLPLLLVSGLLAVDATIEVQDLGTGSASSASDYTFSSPATMIITAGTYDGTTGTAVAVTGLSITDESDVESDETIDFDITSPTGGLIIGDANNDTTTQTTHTYTITNDDTATDTDTDGDPDATDPDDDGDGKPDTEENLAPGGDGNGDGTQDSLQSAVATSENTVSGSYATLQSVGDCDEIDAYSVVSESSLSVQDDEYSYPVGLNGFTLTCGSVGESADITIYYDQEYNTSDWVFRKFNAAGEVYSDISSLVTYGTATVGGNTVTTASYTVTDGDSQTDTDGTANGTIIDPAGPAERAVASITCVEPAIIGNEIYNDLNCNGEEDYGEDGWKDIEVELRDENDEEVDEDDTNKEGKYNLEAPRTGRYKVVIKKSDIDHLLQTEDPGSSVKLNNEAWVTVTECGQRIGNIDFGFSEKECTLATTGADLMCVE